MALFVNDKKHGGIFKNNSQIPEPNQAFFRRDHLAELLKEQKKMNHSLQSSIHYLGVLNKQQSDEQAGRWQEVRKKLHGLQSMNFERNKVEGHVLEKLNVVSDENKQLQETIEKDHLSTQDYLDKIDEIYDLNQMLSKQLEVFDEVSQQISGQIDKQSSVQHDVLNRLENQEALTEKALRQISHFRNTLFERTNFLAEKIENNYKRTASYVYQLLMGTDQSLTLYMMDEEKNKVD